MRFFQPGNGGNGNMPPTAPSFGGKPNNVGSFATTSRVKVGNGNGASESSIRGGTALLERSVDDPYMPTYPETPAEQANGHENATVEVLGRLGTSALDSTETSNGNGRSGTATLERSPLAEAVPIIDSKESIEKQLSTAVEGYSATLGAINESRLQRNKRASLRKQKELITAATGEEITTELAEWLTPTNLAYAIATQEANPNTRYILQYTPNIEADRHDVGAATIAATEAIYQKHGQPKPRYALLKMEPLLARFHPPTLSGTNPGNGKKGAFRLVPSERTPGMEGPFYVLQDKLEKHREANPGVELGPLSLLDVPTYWSTLLALGQDLMPSDSTKDLTFNYHFDLAPNEGTFHKHQLPISSCAFNMDHKNPGRYSDKYGPTIEDLNTGSYGRIALK